MYFNVNGQRATALKVLRKPFCSVTLDKPFDLSELHLLLGK